MISFKLLACISSQGENVAVGFPANVHVIVQHLDRCHPVCVVVLRDLLRWVDCVEVTVLLIIHYHIEDIRMNSVDYSGRRQMASTEGKAQISATRGTHLDCTINCFVDQETHGAHEISHDYEVTPALPKCKKGKTGA